MLSVTGTFALTEEGEEIQFPFEGACRRTIRWRATMTGSFRSERPAAISLRRLVPQATGVVALVGEARRSGEFVDSYEPPCIQAERRFDTTGCEGPWPLRVPSRSLLIGFSPTLTLLGSASHWNDRDCFFFGVPGAEHLLLPRMSSSLTVQRALARKSVVARSSARTVESLGPRFPDATGGATKTTIVSWQVRLVRRPS
ncbi:MAG: hypothetical protein WD689_07040 [Gaiellaceae bacterium]